MKNFTIAVSSLLLALCVLAFPAAAQQNTLGQTTLSAAVAGQILGQGPTGSGAGTPAPIIIQVTSATGIVGNNPNLGVTLSQPNQTGLFIDREFMIVTAVNGTSLTVLRGQRGTIAAPHASGAMVLVGKPFWFYDMDPGGTPNSGTGISGVACVAANVVSSPWVNVRTGGQWVCSGRTNTWVPGFNNPLGTDSAPISGDVASASTIVATGPLFHVTGTTAINTITGVGFPTTTAGGGQICMIPDALGSTGTSGNIAIASTFVVNKILCLTWDAKNSKFVPSY